MLTLKEKGWLILIGSFATPTIMGLVWEILFQPPWFVVIVTGLAIYALFVVCAVLLPKKTRKMAGGERVFAILLGMSVPVAAFALLIFGIEPHPEDAEDF